MKKRVIGICMAVLAISLCAVPSNEDSTVGCRVNLQSEQLDITIPWFLEPDLEIAPSVSFVYAEEVGTDLGVGLSLRKHLRANKVSPFLSLRGGMLMYTPKDGDSYTDFIAGIGGGAEYFFDKHISIGAEYQVNFSFSDEYSYRFGNPDKMNINTASAISITIYW